MSAREPAPFGLEGAVVPRWLVGLRWVVIAVLGCSLPLGGRLFGFDVAYAIAVPALLFIAAVNVRASMRVAKGVRETNRALGLGVALDLVGIAVVLAASGGAANPMSALFLVYVALAASLLPAWTTFSLAALAACLFAGLFALPEGACCSTHPSEGTFSNHLYGMWLAFVLSAGLVAYVLTRVRRALERHKADLVELEAQAEANARFKSLGTLAAGTAHELATPLGTIAVLAGELSDGTTDPVLGAHARGIATQVARCRDILMRMQAGARNTPRKADPSADVDAVAEAAIVAFRSAHPDARVELVGRSSTSVTLSPADLEAALSSLLDNALYATRAASAVEPITVKTEPREGGVAISVEDGGVGVAPELARRLGEPFLTTKEPGEGMGLGLFLVRALVEEAGGWLEVAGRAPRGTRVTLHLEGTT